MEKVMIDNEDKTVVFTSESVGDPDKYKAMQNTVGVRTTPSPAVEDPTVALREQLRQKMTQTITPTATVDIGSVLSDPTQKAIKFGIVGSGHGGSRLAEQFHQFGYRVCVLNTAQQDLAHINLPQDQKLFIDFALGGVGKDLDLGQAAAQGAEPQIKALFEKTFGENAGKIDQIILAIGGGGGTGSGSTIPLIQILSEYGLPITVLYTLPMSSEGTVTKWNAIVTLDKLSKLAVEHLISGLVVIDNSRIEDVYSGVALGSFFKVANFDIANIFNTFNTLSSLPTEYSAIDPMDFARIVSSGNCIIYGKLELPLTVEDGVVAMSEDDIASAMVHNLQGSLLAEGFDLSNAVRAGVYVTGKAAYLQQIPAASFNYAFASLNEHLGKADMYRGVYADERLDDSLVIYTVISGLGLPRDRVETLKAQAEEDINEMQAKEVNTQAKMSVFNQLTNKEKSQYDKMKAKNSAFGKLVERRRTRN